MFEPTTVTINNKIAVTARDKGINNPWLGIHNLHYENRTVFNSTNTTVEWSNWDANEPNNENNIENCTHLYNERNQYSCSFEYIGDEICDDENNKEECDWDGGDCCGSNVNIEYCNFCECHEPNFEVKQCKYKHISNGICNDVNNNEECKWDGGDCCGDDVVTTECSACECLEPFRWNDDNCDELRRFICEKEGTG